MASYDDDHFNGFGKHVSWHFLMQYNLVDLRAFRDLAFERSGHFCSLLRPSKGLIWERVNVDIPIKEDSIRFGIS